MALDQKPSIFFAWGAGPMLLLASNLASAVFPLTDLTKEILQTACAKNHLWKLKAFLAQ